MINEPFLKLYSPFNRPFPNSLQWPRNTVPSRGWSKKHPLQPRLGTIVSWSLKRIRARFITNWILLHNNTFTVVARGHFEKQQCCISEVVGYLALLDILGAYHNIEKNGNSGWKNKWYVSFRIESFGKLGLPIEVISFFQPEFPDLPCKW
jgi:hypothetical protein